MDALITAGGIPAPADPLYPYTHGEAKSLLPLAGKPVVQWVLDAVSACDDIDNILIVGLQPDNTLGTSNKTHYLANQGDLITNIRMGLLELSRISPQEPYALLISGDTPGITAAMLDWMIAQVKTQPHEFYYPVVERRRMEARYPGSRRTFLRFKDIEVCGGDVMALNKTLANKTMPRIQQLVSARKQPLRQAAMIGFDILLLLALRQLTLAGAVRRICPRLGVDGIAIPAPYAEMAMDIDKPYQLELLEQDFMSHSTREDHQ
ncbi:MAG: NTP transferase domain-containing protein [Anaerolineae bacterium]|jgi:CTP:molybdopterin cytidylyltransferase MocA|nr:NTP transferase domain-containing protein [Anaerolineae bacterium]